MGCLNPFGLRAGQDLARAGSGKGHAYPLIWPLSEAENFVVTESRNTGLGRVKEGHHPKQEDQQEPGRAVGDFLCAREDNQKSVWCTRQRRC